MREKYSSKGITLIALVVTIVVLLILAGVTINMLFSDTGIIKTAQKAKDAQKIAEYKDRIELAKLSVAMQNNGNVPIDKFLAELKKEGIVTDSQVTANVDGSYTITPETGIEIKVTPTVDGNNVTVTYPETIKGNGESSSGGDTPGKDETTVKAQSVSLSQTTANLKVGETLTLTATVLPENTTNKSVTWNSSNSAVATVNDGVVTAVAKGSTTITVKTADGSDKTATCELTVTSQISTEDSYVGYYADIEEDGNVDGIIYVDLAKGKTKDGNWGYSDGAYNITPVTEGLKEYKISTKTYEGQTEAGVYKANDGLGTKQVITPVTGSTGKERFYIMALKDSSISSSGSDPWYWYSNAYGKLEDSYTSTSFGSGKSNTVAMKSKWDLGENGGYGAQNSLDMWGKLNQKIATDSRWFVPSKEEWAAFALELGMNSANYSKRELFAFYWSSSVASSKQVFCISLKDDYLTSVDCMNKCNVRLSATY